MTLCGKIASYKEDYATFPWANFILDILNSKKWLSDFKDNGIGSKYNGSSLLGTAEEMRFIGDPAKCLTSRSTLRSGN